MNFGDMESWVFGIAQHGYAILFAAVFLESVLDFHCPLHSHCWSRALRRGAVCYTLLMR